MIAERYAQEFSRKLKPTSKLGRAAAARRRAAAAAGGGTRGGGGYEEEGVGDGDEDLDNAHIAFLPVSVLRFSSKSAPFPTMALEPHLPGEHVKHNDNTGRVETDKELPQAFTHFTLHASRGELCVCDIQGKV